MLPIPNTTTVASEQTIGFTSFPPDAGALTPFVAGYLFIANQSAQISIRKGPTAPGTWTPYSLISPTLVPLSTDRGGRASPDKIWGVKAIDGVAGIHAQVFGSLFQAGEAGFVPSAQFAGTVAPSGGFTPPVSGDLVALFPTQVLTVPTASVSFSPIPQTSSNLWVVGLVNGTANGIVNINFNNDFTALYDTQTVVGNAAAASAAEAFAATSGQVTGITNNAGLASALDIRIPGYTNTTFGKVYHSTFSRKLGVAGGNLQVDQIAGFYRGTSNISVITLTPSVGTFAAGSSFSLYGLA